MNSYYLWVKIKKHNCLPFFSCFNFYIKQSASLNILLTRTIKTQGGPRKGKLSVVKKKIDYGHLGIENLETEDAASVIKRFNFENKKLFGDLIDTVKHTCKKFTKKSKRHKFKPHKTTMTYNETTIPIQEVTVSTDLNSICPAFQLTNNVLDSVLDFPLMDKFNSKDETEETTNKSNYLRQCLEKLSENKKYPSITSILDATMPPERVKHLENWKLSMIAQMGEERFEKYHKDMLFHGSSLHQSITGYLSKIPELQAELLPGNVGHWKSLQSILPSVKEVRLLEEHITHPFLCYTGVVDCLAQYGEHFVVIDWKTSKKPKLSLSSTYDSPLQIAAYAGALNFDPKFKYMVNKGLIVVAYENGTPATVHLLNEQALLDNWHKWLQRLKIYWEKT